MSGGDELLQPFEPSAASPFGLPQVGHLLRRAGFGGSLAVRRRLAAAGPAAAFEHLLGDGAASTAGLDAAVVALGDADRLRAYRVWLALESPAQLQQRLSSWWHGHFATGNQKVQDARQMAAQMATFDRLGLGRFDELARAMVRDAALLRWLDNDVSTKQQPNENFAREWFELFTLGRGHYSEQDVKAAARCFTGWHVRDGQFVFVPYLHDDGEKTLFGTTGRLGGDDVVSLSVGRRASAEWLAGRWLRHFVHPMPTDDEVAALADAYERNDRDVLRTLRVLLQSRLFYSPRAYRSRIKSPADFVIGTVRALDARASATELAAAMASLGEAWLEPPSVEGWHQERAWLSPASWLLRSNFVADLFAGRRGKLSPGAEFVFDGLTRPEHFAKAAGLVLLDGDVGALDLERLAAVAAAAPAGPARAAAVLHAAACLPTFQLC